MTELMFSAHDLCITRLCQAGGCESDAMPGWALCDRHDRMHRRGVKFRMHEIPTTLGDTLHCNLCGEHKPDEAFSYHRGQRGRRYRRHECKECANAAKRAQREANREAIRARERSYRARLRAAKRASA